MTPVSRDVFDKEAGCLGCPELTPHLDIEFGVNPG